MTILESLSNTQILWAKVTDAQAPPERTIIRWLATYGYEMLEKSIVRIPWRFRDKQPDAESVYRFVSADLGTARAHQTGGPNV
jgi:hypothetical protein